MHSLDKQAVGRTETDGGYTVTSFLNKNKRTQNY